MTLAYTGEELIAAVRNLGMISDTGSLGARDQDILDHLTAVLQTIIVPEIIKVQEDYFVVSQRIPLSANTSRYRIPSRAIGNKLRDIWYVDSDGNRNRIVPIKRDELDNYNSSTGLDWPSCYYPEGNYIVLAPSISGSVSGSLEMIFYFRPGELIISTEAVRITDITGSVVTCSTDIPSTWTTDDEFDIHSFKSGAEIKVWDAVASSVGPVGNENQITFTTAIDGTTFGTYSAEIGDYICLAGEAAIPMIPRDFHAVLVRGAALRVAEAFGDAQGLQMHGALFKNDLNTISGLLEVRVESNPLKIIGNKSIVWSQING